MKSILVTGGAGFIGSHIVDIYLNAGYEVIVVDNLLTGKTENINSAAKFYQIDLLDDELESVFKEHKISAINHHASQIDVRKSVEDPVYDATVNIIGLLKLLQLSVKYKAEKIIFASSGGVVYGEPEYLPVDISHSLNPISPYGASKLASELYIKIYKQLYDLDYSILRYANVYGPRQDPYGEAGVVAIFIEKLINNEKLVIYGDGNQLRDYIYVGDVAKLNLESVSLRGSAIINVGTGIGTSVNELSDLLISLMNKNTGKQFKPKRVGELEKIYLKCENNTLNWKPKTSLSKGLNKTISYFTDKCMV